ncbi:uncharacterized protein LOC113515078 [Galleria mellonella]|uniref:Uncharacterized protein LOC113515078 n=1 Tax=Galleria mellonella TaxID=7137 RepID=A0A6J3C2E0_GALME|nr:uncharacterized protein LOC113515078 [Galleria mellonella]XP_031766521.2 uncharacterized protein LOC113515078 [Galleria mellonella]
MGKIRKRTQSTSEKNVKVKPLGLKILKKDKDVNSLNSLCAYSIVKCDFCEEIFFNKYNYLIHNARHIIIPLIKQIVHQCTICLYYFTSEHKLLRHVTKKHSSQKCNNNIDSELQTGESESLIVNMDNKELPVPKTELLQDTNILNNGNTELQYFDGNSGGIKNRILFEDDIESNGVMADLTTDCQVAVEMFNAPWLVKLLNQQELQDLNDHNGSHDNDAASSVHYDELMESKLHVCKFCGVTSSNRYWAIRHELEHVTIKQKKLYLCQKCDYYISDRKKELMQHIKKKHGAIIKRDSLTRCRTCGLDYNSFYRHNRNYHLIYGCKLCGAKFSDEMQLDEHCVDCETVDLHVQCNKETGQESAYESRTMKICDICYSFLRNKVNLHYIYVGDHCEIGDRLPCEKCSRKCFELKIVKRVYMSKHHRKPRRVMTNEDRLKNIKQRLKMMRKYLSLFYSVDCRGLKKKRFQFCFFF